MLIDAYLVCRKAESDPNVIAARRLLDYLGEWLPNEHTSEDEWLKFYDDTIHIIINDKVFSFYPNAVVYSKLEELADYVIEQI